jgi:hypothetical protein
MSYARIIYLLTSLPLVHPYFTLVASTKKIKLIDLLISKVKQEKKNKNKKQKGKVRLNRS